MRPIQTATTTESLDAPTDWNPSMHGECTSLPIARAHGMMFSYWLPSTEEIADIMMGKPVRLGVFGNRHPVVSVDTQL
jgi:hypothetical protein